MPLVTIFLEGEGQETIVFAHGAFVEPLDVS